MSTPHEREQAEKLFEDLRSGLVNAEALIIKIIQTKAWVHLGYTSFVEAWNDRMQGVRLASEALRAHVVYALLSDGLSDSRARLRILGMVPPPQFDTRRAAVEWIATHG